VKTRHLILCLLACCTQLAVAQSLKSPGLTVSVVPVASAYEGVRANPNTNASDRITLAKADQTRNGLEASLKDYLVAFDSQLVKERYRVGLPLASFANKQIDVAYDLSAKNVMAQWRFAQSTTSGQRFDYQAYVGASGGVSLVLSSRF